MKGQLTRIFVISSCILYLLLFGAIPWAREAHPVVPKNTVQVIPYHPSQLMPRLANYTATKVAEVDFRRSGPSGGSVSVWQIGAPPAGIPDASRHRRVLGSGLKSGYPPNCQARWTGSWHHLPELVRSTDHIVLQFTHWFQLESGYDSGYVEISLNGRDWERLWGISGTSGSWRTDYLFLDRFAGQDVQLSFRLVSDSTHQFDGWLIDRYEILHYQAPPLQVHILSLDHTQFPWIFLHAEVDSYGVASHSFTASQFSVTENGVPQQNGFQVTPPGVGNFQRMVDVVFLMDNSGSMSGEQMAVRQNVHNFVNQLSASGADFALGLIRFGSLTNNGAPILTNNGNVTTDPSYFLNSLWTLNTTNGGHEPGWDAIHAAATQINYRPGALRVAVLITDENVTDDGNMGTYTRQQALQAALNNHLIVFAMINLSEAHSYSDYGTIAEQTGGTYFHVTDPMDGVLQAIGNALTSNYIVRYQSSDPTPVGQREVVLTVQHQYSTAQDTAYYVPGTNMILELTQATWNLIQNQQPFHAPLTISVKVYDPSPPYVHQVTLYYRKAGLDFYQSTAMNPVPGQPDIWEGIIPATAVDTPSVQFYLEARDSTSSATLPTLLPQQNPFEIAIYPNYLPFVYHFPPVQTMDTSATIYTAVYDQTNQVDSCRILWRKSGDILWQAVRMTGSPPMTIAQFAQLVARHYQVNSQLIVDSMVIRGQRFGHSFTANTPIHVYQYELSKPGSGINQLWYYLEAFDDHQTRGTDGTADQPYQLNFLADIARYAPILRFDPEEKYYPLSVENYLSHCKLMDYEGCYPFDHGNMLSFPVSPYQLRGNHFLELADFPLPGEELNISYDYTGYYKEFTDSVKNRRVIQYWFLYPYNYSIFNAHEGDWEHVDVVFEPIDATTPVRLITSFHDFYFVYNWNELEFRGTHPVVFVDRTSHAMAAQPDNCARILYNATTNSLSSFTCSQVFNTITLVAIIKDIITAGAGTVVDPFMIATGLILTAGCKAALQTVFAILYSHNLTPEEKAQYFARAAQFCYFSREGKLLSPGILPTDTSYVLLPVDMKWGSARVFWGSKWSRAAHHLQTFALPLDYTNDLNNGLVFNVNNNPFVWYQSGPVSPLNHPPAGEYDILFENLASPPLIPTTVFAFSHNLIGQLELPSGGGGAFRKVFSTQDSTNGCDPYSPDAPHISYIRTPQENFIVLRSTQPVQGRLILSVPDHNSTPWSLRIVNMTRKSDLKEFNFSGELDDNHPTVSIPFRMLAHPDGTTDILLTHRTQPELSDQTVFAFPNPFNLTRHNQVNIRYSLAHNAQVTISIYDVSGFRVKTLAKQVSQLAHQQYSIQWDGTNEQGKPVANGVYYYKISSSEGEQAIGKILVIR